MPFPSNNGDRISDALLDHGLATNKISHRSRTIPFLLATALHPPESHRREPGRSRPTGTAVPTVMVVAATALVDDDQASAPVAKTLRALIQ
jgi:hypothetical protein